MADIIDFGEARLQRVHSTPKADGSTCSHNRVTYCTEDEVVHCLDCNNQISPFKAFMLVLNNIERKETQLRMRERELEMALEKGLTLLAARKVEDAWRCRNTVPACPHCGAGILTSDGLGTKRVDKAATLKRRKSVLK